MKHFLLLSFIFLTGCGSSVELMKLPVTECSESAICSPEDLWFGSLDESHRLNIRNLSDTTVRALLLKLFPEEAPNYLNQTYTFEMRMGWDVPANASDFAVSE